jgi:hypothetical protein
MYVYENYILSSRMYAIHLKSASHWFESQLYAFSKGKGYNMVPLKQINMFNCNLGPYHVLNIQVLQ